MIDLSKVRTSLRAWPSDSLFFYGVLHLRAHSGSRLTDDPPHTA